MDYAPSEIWGRGLWWWEGDSGAYSEYACNNAFVFDCEALYVGANWTNQVTSKVLSNGQSWAYSYARSKTSGQYDVTTIVGPAGTDTYSYIGEGYFTVAANPRFNWATNLLTYDYGTIVNSRWNFIADQWKLGLLVQMTKGNKLTESYQWSARLHSDIFFAATSGKIGLRDDRTYAPKLTQKTIIQDGLTYLSVYTGYDTYGNVGTVTATGPSGP